MQYTEPARRHFILLIYRSLQANSFVSISFPVVTSVPVTHYSHLCALYWGLLQPLKFLLAISFSSPPVSPHHQFLLTISFSSPPVSPHHQFPWTHLCSSYSLQSPVCPVLRLTAASPVSPHHQFPCKPRLLQLLTTATYVPCTEVCCILSIFSSPLVSLQPRLFPIMRLIAASYFPYQFHSSHLSNFLSIFCKTLSQFAVPVLLFPNLFSMLLRRFTQGTAHIQAIFKFHH